MTTRPITKADRADAVLRALQSRPKTIRITHGQGSTIVVAGYLNLTVQQLASIPKPERRILSRYLWDKRSIAEIASASGIKPRHVRRVLRRHLRCLLIPRRLP